MKDNTIIPRFTDFDGRIVDKSFNNWKKYNFYPNGSSQFCHTLESPSITMGKNSKQNFIDKFENVEKYWVCLCKLKQM